MQKARHHPSPCRAQRAERQALLLTALHVLRSALHTVRRALTACRHVVSGSVSSPCRGSSHLSLALLGSLSVAREYLALGDGPPRFRLASTCRVLLRCRIVRFHLPHTGLSPAMADLSRVVLLGYSLSKHRPYNPSGASRKGLGYSAFARPYCRR